MRDQDKNRNWRVARGIGEEVVDVGAEIATAGVIDIAFEAAGSVVSGAAVDAGEIVGGALGGIADGI